MPLLDTTSYLNPDPIISDNQLSPGGSLTTSNYLGTEISLAFMELENYIIRPAVKEDCLTIQLLIQVLVLKTLSLTFILSFTENLLFF